jgi:hypothetical protein
MRNIINEIFGKMENISKQDIENCIMTPSLRESVNLEYKSLHRIEQSFKDSKDNDKKEGVLIKPLVAFLNKFSSEGGLLLLGVSDKDGVPDNIAPARKGFFSSEQFRSWIHENISAIPSIRDFPQLNIKEITINGNSIFLIEIHPIDIYTVYYSKITNNVYQRKNDESVSISLPDAVKLISEKVCAKVFIDIKEVSKKSQDPLTELHLDFSFINDGVKPGEWVKALLSFRLLKGQRGHVRIFSVSTNWSARNPLIENEFNAYIINEWLHDIVYPKVLFGIGEIGLYIGSNEEIRLNSTVYEKEGKSEQQFSITSQGIHHDSSEFRRYID